MSQSLLLPESVPSVSLHDGRPATTSLEIAKFFGRRHDDVVKGIRNLMNNCPELFSARNFAGASYLDEQAKSRPMYIIHRDGFMLLVMGYTGKKALAIKLAYIEAFNAMEAELARKNRPALTAARKSRVKALPETSAVPARIDERPYLQFVEEIEQAHEEVREIVGELASRMNRLTDAVCGEIEQRAKMKHLIPNALHCMSLNGVISDRMYAGLRDALIYPAARLDGYSNPGLALLGIVRQLNGR